MGRPQQQMNLTNEAKSLTGNAILSAREDGMSGDNTSASKSGKQSKTKLIPSPLELIAHYESQGMDTQEASVKVIQDLQNVLFRLVASTRGSSSNRSNPRKREGSIVDLMAETSRKLDLVNARLITLDTKLDSKPGYAQTLAIGAASGAILRGIPHVAAAFAQIWNLFRKPTSGHGPTT